MGLPMYGKEDRIASSSNNSGAYQRPSNTNFGQRGMVSRQDIFGANGEASITAGGTARSTRHLSSAVDSRSDGHRRDQSAGENVYGRRHGVSDDRLAMAEMGSWVDDYSQNQGEYERRGYAGEAADADVIDNRHHRHAATSTSAGMAGTRQQSRGYGSRSDGSRRRRSYASEAGSNTGNSSDTIGARQHRHRPSERYSPPSSSYRRQQ